MWIVRKVSVLFLVVFVVACSGDDDSTSEMYSVGGAVDQNFGKLTLSLNGIEELEIYGSEQFEFETQLAEGELFSVKVVSHPDSQSCEIREPSGIIENIDANKMKVDCRSYYRGLANATEIAVGDDHSCAIKDGRIRCWGNNANGQTDVPEGIVNPHSLVASTAHTCAIGDAGVFCWGAEYIKAVPNTLVSPQRLYSNSGSVCAIDVEGTRCWGAFIGDAAFLSNMEGVTQVGSSLFHYCAKDADGIRCWDKFTNEELVLPSGLNSDSSLYVGELQSCALTGGQLTCWSDTDFWGDLEVPIPPTGLSDPSSISMGLFITSCLIDDGEIICWGDDYLGVQNVPSDISNPTMLDVGRSHACAIDDLGVVCWGRKNKSGQITVPFI